MYKIGFDNDKYLSLQSEKIKERIAKFGGKLYLNSRQAADDYHAFLFCPVSIRQQDQYAGTAEGRGRNRHRH